MNRHHNAAFSLVELSIVLVILGLLTGGILTGQSLIKAAELRAVSTEYNNYQTAVNAFRQKYFALPGDMANAASFWTTSANGNANDQIAGAERYRFWQHLSLAGLAEGNYTGAQGAGGAEHHIITVGTTQNTPSSKFSSAGWNVHYAMASTDFGNAAPNPAADYYTVVYGGNVFEFGTPSTNNRMTGAALIPEDAWNIDTKIDDGRPGLGNVLARRAVGANACGSGAVGDSATATYQLTDTVERCALIFKNAM